MVNKAQIKLKFRCFFFIIIFLFFCRLVLKCFIYREMVNIKDHKLSEIFLTVGLVEPIQFVRNFPDCRACRANTVCSKISHLYIQ